MKVRRNKLHIYIYIYIYIYIRRDKANVTVVTGGTEELALIFLRRKLMSHNFLRSSWMLRSSKLIRRLEADDDNDDKA